jgi:hypothetical protein
VKQRPQQGHKPEQLKVGLHMIGFVADNTKETAIFRLAHTFTKSARNRAGRQPSRAIRRFARPSALRGDVDTA